MKILNLYAGIGGNRKLWGDDHEITAVEYDQATAEVYTTYFPNDTVIVADAHDYLLNNYKYFDQLFLKMLHLKNSMQFFVLFLHVNNWLNSQLH